MNMNIKKIPLSHFHLIKKPTMNDLEYISEWLTDVYNNHKELKGYALYHNLNGFIPAELICSFLFLCSPCGAVSRYSRNLLHKSTFISPKVHLPCVKVRKCI